jgi:hypothetical protein
MIETQLPCIACLALVPALILPADLNHQTPVTFCTGCLKQLNTTAKRRAAIARWRTIP